MISDASTGLKRGTVIRVSAGTLLRLSGSRAPGMLQDIGPAETVE
jgi:hypothetical protein